MAVRVEVSHGSTSYSATVEDGAKFWVDEHGCLLVQNAAGQTVAAYPPAQWLNAKVVG